MYQYPTYPSPTSPLPTYPTNYPPNVVYPPNEAYPPYVDAVQGAQTVVNGLTATQMLTTQNPPPNGYTYAQMQHGGFTAAEITQAVNILQSSGQWPSWRGTFSIANLTGTPGNAQGNASYTYYDLVNAGYSNAQIAAAGVQPDPNAGPSYNPKQLTGNLPYIPLQIMQYPTETSPPTGTIIANPTNFDPPGYILCNGAAYSRSYYYPLFRIIGTYYGAGDGSTTFNVPSINNNYDKTIRYMIKFDAQ